MNRIALPDDVALILSAFAACGYSAYAVGGCVRDCLMGKVPADWDICTSALPAQTKEVFAAHRLLNTGLAHGTVTLLLGGREYEITTFRTDGVYRDGRHPDRVDFVGDVAEDLRRRDFTVNAMAYQQKDGLIDLFGGREDIALRRIRCVGEPERRFGEDALRILRALRFACVLDFAIAPATAGAIHALKDKLGCVANERMSAELTKLLQGPAAARVLGEYGDVLGVCLPELAPGFEGPCWQKGLDAIARAEPDLPLRLALLLHFCDGGDAEQALRRLRFDGGTVAAVYDLLRDASIPVTADRAALKRLLGELGVQRLGRLLSYQRALLSAEVGEELVRAQEMMEDILRKGECYSRAGLAVSGRDLLAMGMAPGPEVGALLENMLALVIAGELINNKENLLKYVAKIQKKTNKLERK